MQPAEKVRLGWIELFERVRDAGMVCRQCAVPGRLYISGGGATRRMAVPLAVYRELSLSDFPDNSRSARAGKRYCSSQPTLRDTLNVPYVRELP